MGGIESKPPSKDQSASHILARHRATAKSKRKVTVGIERKRFVASQDVKKGRLRTIEVIQDKNRGEGEKYSHTITKTARVALEWIKKNGQLALVVGAVIDSLSGMTDVLAQNIRKVFSFFKEDKPYTSEEFYRETKLVNSFNYLEQPIREVVHDKMEACKDSLSAREFAALESLMKRYGSEMVDGTFMEKMDEVIEGLPGLSNASKDHVRNALQDVLEIVENETKHVTETVDFMRTFEQAIDAQMSYLRHVSKQDSAFSYLNSVLDSVEGSIDGGNFEAAVQELAKVRERVGEDDKKQRNVRAALAYAINALREKGNGKIWKTTSYDRDIAAKEGIDGLRKRYVPVIQNTSYHTCSFPSDEKIEVLRSGSMTDHTDGTTSLQILDDLKTALTRVQKGETLDSKDEKKVFAQMQAAGFFDQAIGLKIEDLVSFLPDIERRYEDRFRVISTMFVQKIQDHMTHFFDQIHDENSALRVLDRIPVTQMMLFDAGKSASLFPGGVVQNERRIFEDNVHIWKHFNGAEIVFGDEGPFPGEDGKIYLKALRKVEDEKGTHFEKVKADEAAKGLKIDTVLFNVSPQGFFTWDQTRQTELNQASLEKLEVIGIDFVNALKVKRGTEGLSEELEKKLYYMENEWFPKLNRVKKRLLDKKESSFKVVVTVEELCVGVGFTGINCASGKDRTGEAVAELLDRVFAQLAGKGQTYLQHLFERQTYKTAMEVCKKSGSRLIKVLNPKGAFWYEKISNYWEFMKEKVKAWGR